MDSAKYTARQLLIKNKCLFFCCILFIMLSLFMTCYLFFFRTITIDVTKHAEIVYNGESGSATVTASNGAMNLNQRTQEFLDSITYQITPKNNIANGTIIQIQAQYDENLAKQYHIEVINETREIEVKGLAERYADVEQIDQDYLKKMDQYADRYFKNNEKAILEDDFTEFYAGSEREYIGKTRKFRVFLQALNRENKDKIVDVYCLRAKGMINTATDHEALEEKEIEIYYMLTFDDINSAKQLREENVFGEKIIGIAVNTQDDLVQVLHQKYLLSYRISLME